MNQLTPEEHLAGRRNPAALATLTDAPCLGSVLFLDGTERVDRRRLAEIGAPIAPKLRGEERS
jgi:hypothetical protein